MDLNKKKVLICDDNTIVLFMLKGLFSKNNLDVYTANDGKEGYDKTLTTHFDFIITDIEMPNMNGWELIESIQKNGFDMKKVIVMTAQLEHKITPNIKKYDVLKYYLKPILPLDIEEITTLIYA